MDHYEHELLRLNKKIKELIGRNEQTLKYNLELEKYNEKVTIELEELKEIASKTSSMNVKYKCALEKETTDRQFLYQANQKHKQRLNSLSEKCKLQMDTIRTLEHSLRNSSGPRTSSSSVQIIGSMAEFSINNDKKKQNDELQQKFNDTEDQLHAAHDLIDELEFEIESIDYLESENSNLRQQLKDLEELMQAQTFETTHPKPVLEQEEGVPFSLPSIDEVNNQTDESKSDEYGIQLLEKQLRRNVLQKKIEQIHEKQLGSNF